MVRASTNNRKSPAQRGFFVCSRQATVGWFVARNRAAYAARNSSEAPRPPCPRRDPNQRRNSRKPRRACERTDWGRRPHEGKAAKSDDLQRSDWGSLVRILGRRAPRTIGPTATITLRIARLALILKPPPFSGRRPCCGLYVDHYDARARNSRAATSAAQFRYERDEDTAAQGRKSVRRGPGSRPHPTEFPTGPAA